MKIISCLTSVWFLLLISLPVKAQLFQTHWVEQSIPGDALESAKLESDAAGNVYALCALSGAAQIGPLAVASPPVRHALLKYDASGTCLWATPLPLLQGNGSSYSQFIALPDGRCYLAGTFGGSVVFGSITLQSNGPQDVFVLQLNASDGQPEWAVRLGGNMQWQTGNNLPHDALFGLAANANGTCFLTGTFATGFTIGSSAQVYNSQQPTQHVVKLNADGSLGFAAELGFWDALSTPLELKVAASPSGQSYVMAEGWIRKFTPSGTEQWTKNIQAGNTIGSQSFITRQIRMEAEDHFYIAGDIAQQNGSLVFGPDTLAVNSVISGSFLASIDSAGQPAWGRLVMPDLNGSFNPSVNSRSIRIYTDGSVCLLVTFGGTIHIIGSQLTSTGFMDNAVITYSPAGAVSGSFRFGTSGTETVPQLALGVGNSYYLTATLNPDFSIGSTTIPHQGAHRFFGRFSQDISIGLNAGPSNQPLQLYPNPASKSFVLEMPVGWDPTTCALTITNALGRVLLQQNITAATQIINTDKWPSGMYQVLLNGPDSSQTTKLMIE